MLGDMMGDIDPQLGQYFESTRMDVAGRIGSSAVDLHQVTGEVPQDALRHVATAGIARTQDQYLMLVHGNIIDEGKETSIRKRLPPRLRPAKREISTLFVTMGNSNSI